MKRRDFFKLALLNMTYFLYSKNTLLSHSENTAYDNSKAKTNSSNALIIVDVQNDFCPGGSLPVKNGNNVVPVINKLQEEFNFIVLTQDWHPKDHTSFSTNNPGQKVFTTKDLPYGKQVIWPPHCVIGTSGADFHKDLNTNKANLIIRKGFRKEIDSYSGFFENDKITHTGLDGALKNAGIKKVFVVGLALDFCVQYTALDSKRLGFETYVIKQATLPVDIGSSVEETMKNFKKYGIKLIDKYS